MGKNRKIKAAGILVFVGVGIGFINEYRWVVKKEKEIDARMKKSDEEYAKKEKEIDARMKKRAEEYAKKMASYGDIGRLFYVPEEQKDEQVKA